MVFCVGFITSITLTTAVVTMITHVALNVPQQFRSILHACTVFMFRNIPYAYTATSCIHIPRHACITISYTLSCCIVHRSVYYGILFASTSHVLQHLACMYCIYISQYPTYMYRACTTASCVHVLHACTAVSRAYVSRLSGQKEGCYTNRRKLCHTNK